MSAYTWYVITVQVVRHLFTDIMAKSAVTRTAFRLYRNFKMSFEMQSTCNSPLPTDMAWDRETRYDVVFYVNYVTSVSRFL